MPVLLKKEKEGVKLDFVPPKQIDADMDQLLTYYGAKETHADKNKARQILSRFDINKELTELREESR